MAKRYFTVAEADALVPWLEQAMGRLLRLRAQLRTVGAQLSALGETLDEAGAARPDGPQKVVALRAYARGLRETVTDELRALAEAGVELKDPETGLCDFVARHDGRDVYLCWRFGEKKVAFWHELHTGFAGRQPLGDWSSKAMH